LKAVSLCLMLRVPHLYKNGTGRDTHSNHAGPTVWRSILGDC